MAKAEQQVLLAGLTENYPIESQPLLQPFELPNLLTVREQWNAALDTSQGQDYAANQKTDIIRIIFQRRSYEVKD